MGRRARAFCEDRRHLRALRSQHTALLAPRSRPCAAYYDDIFVGTVGCRVEPIDGTPHKRLYIAVLAVLAPYRDRGIGACSRAAGAGVSVGRAHRSRHAHC